MRQVSFKEDPTPTKEPSFQQPSDQCGQYPELTEAQFDSEKELMEELELDPGELEEFERFQRLEEMGVDLDKLDEIPEDLEKYQ